MLTYCRLVEALLESRDEGKQFVVKWLGYTKVTVEPASHIPANIRNKYACGELKWGTSLFPSRPEVKGVDPSESEYDCDQDKEVKDKKAKNHKVMATLPCFCGVILTSMCVTCLQTAGVLAGLRPCGTILFCRELFVVGTHLLISCPAGNADQSVVICREHCASHCHLDCLLSTIQPLPSLFGCVSHSRLVHGM